MSIGWLLVLKSNGRTAIPFCFMDTTELNGVYISGLSTPVSAHELVLTCMDTLGCPHW